MIYVHRVESVVSALRKLYHLYFASGIVLSIGMQQLYIRYIISNCLLWGFQLTVEVLVSATALSTILWCVDCCLLIYLLLATLSSRETAKVGRWHYATGKSFRGPKGTSDARSPLEPNLYLRYLWFTLFSLLHYWPSEIRWHAFRSGTDPRQRTRQSLSVHSGNTQTVGALVSDWTGCSP